jgi:excisionase family DNA binding protein
MPRTQTDPTIPTDQDARLAREASRVLDASSAAEGALRVRLVETGGAPPATLELPAAAARLLKELLREMGAGHAVTLVPIEAEITTQQAADLLNVSRPYVVGLVEQGKLPARMVGPQRRIRLADVLAYKAESKAKARAALREMVAIDQELGLE